MYSRNDVAMYRLGQVEFIYLFVCLFLYISWGDERESVQVARWVAANGGGR